jgi:hypothetical protein
MTPPPERSWDAILQIQRRGLSARLGKGALGLLVVPMLLLITQSAYLESSRALATFLGWLMLGAPILSMAALATWLLRLNRPGVIAIRDGELVITRGRRQKRIPLAQLTEGWLSPLRGEVELHTRAGDRVRVLLETIEDGKQLLEAAGLDERRRTMRMQLGETAFLDIMTWLVGPAVVLPITMALGRRAPWPGPLNVLVFMGLFWLLFRLVRALWGPAAVVIGADGLILRGALRTRFIPFGRLASVDAGPEHLVLHLTDGTSASARVRHLSAAQIEQLRARLDAATAAWKAGAPGPAALARLDRNGRAPEAWRAALEALLHGPEGYREAAVTREDLLSVLENPGAPAERRIGAALALAARPSGEDRVRIRVAAEACANPRMRIALEQVARAEVEDAAIEEALAAEEAARAAR